LPKLNEMLLRLKLLFTFIFFIFFVLLVRLYYWQISKNEELSIQAKMQQQSSLKINAPRGSILASDKSYLAVSKESWLIFANLPEIEEQIDSIADRLSPLFVENVDDKDALLSESNRIKEVLSKKKIVWAPLKQRVETSVKEKIQKMGIKGIGFEEQEVRYYPEASISAHLLGFVGKNSNGGDQGYFGLEGYYDIVLSGKPGYLVRDSDATGLPIAGENFKEMLAIKGADLLTYIDRGVNLKLDKKLREGIERYGAKGGTAIVMDPKTGGIIAMSSYPSYDPRKYFNFNDQLFQNPAIAVSFEPGSIFKVLIMASALDAKVVEPSTKCDLCKGPIKIDKYTIETWNKVYYPESNMTDVIIHSDNVGMVFVGQKLGVDKMLKYLSLFGIGEKTEIDLQGEMNPGLRKKEDWGLIDLATASFGQGVAVTPIQMIRAVGAIANKGVILKPKVVNKIVGDGWEMDVKKDTGKRIISERAAREITTMMVQAAEKGESKWTNLKGFRVAGKTGTAQIPIKGHYDEEKTIASFIGFAPYEDPKFVMLVTLREPQSSPWASETAAPLWYSIAKDLFIHFGIQPKN